MTSWIIKSFLLKIIDKNTVHVQTEITAVDMGPVLTDFFATALEEAIATAFEAPLSEEENDKSMEELFMQSVSKPDWETVSNEVTIEVVRVGKEWKVNSDDNLVNALLGGLSDVVKEVEDTLNKMQ